MLTYIPAMPASARVARGESLNLLGGVANDGEALTLDITVWGRVDRTWEPLVTRAFTIDAHEHKHLYFTLGPDCFAPERWGGEIEDIELRVDHQRPDASARGALVFVE